MKKPFALAVALVLCAVVLFMFGRAAFGPTLQQQLEKEDAARAADLRQRDETTAQVRAVTQPPIDKANAQQLTDYHEQRQARIAAAEYARTHERGIEKDTAWEAQHAAAQASPAPAEPAAAPDPEPPAIDKASARSPIRRDPKTVGVSDQAPDAEKRLLEQIAAPKPPATPAKPSYAITLKDGRTIDAVQLVDGGDVYSVKTAAGKFVTLKKADVADVPAALLPKR